MTAVPREGMDTAMKTYSVTHSQDLGNDASPVEVGEMPDVCTYGRTLAEAGVSRRDSARMLGVSHQRVQQLVAG